MDRTRTRRSYSSQNEDGCPNSNRPVRPARNFGRNTLETNFALTRFCSDRSHLAGNFRSAARPATVLAAQRARSSPVATHSSFEVEGSQNMDAQSASARTGCLSFGFSFVAWLPLAGVAELADALDSKSSDRKIVWVRSPPPAGWPPFCSLETSLVEMDAAQINY
jgi:hypothetical protein